VERGVEAADQNIRVAGLGRSDDHDPVDRRAQRRQRLTDAIIAAG